MRVVWDADVSVRVGVSEVGGGPSRLGLLEVTSMQIEESPGVLDHVLGPCCET
jgi:hypothetical protein